MMTERPLSAQQEHFARLIVEGKSQAEAYRQAYPRSCKWKSDAVHQQASVMMAQPKVSSRVAELQGQAAEVAVLKAADTLREIKRLCFSDIRRVMHVDGRLKLPGELDADTAAAVASFKIDEMGRIEYKFWDKNSALERAAKVLGLFEKDNKQKTDPLVSLLQGLSGNTIGPVAEPATHDDN